MKLTVNILLLFLALSCDTKDTQDPPQQDMTEMNKKNIGNVLALYPKPLTVVGTMVNGKWKSQLACGWPYRYHWP